MQSQNIIDVFLSDHMPFIVKNKEGESYLSWNILYQMKFNPSRKFYNNGFGCAEETEEEYLNRLNHIAIQLSDVVKMENTAFICLQECPKTKLSQDHFEEIIMKELNHYKIHRSNDQTDEYMMTLSDSRYYTFIPELTKEIMDIPLKEGMLRRTLPLVFLHNVSNKPFLIVNVHASFSEHIKKDIRSFHNAAKQFNIADIILIGDFNRDLIEQSDSYSKHDVSESLDEQHHFDGLYVNTLPKSSFIIDNKMNEKKVLVETRDGVISNFPVHIKCMPYMNSPNVKMSFNKNICKFLSDIPQEFKDN